MAEVSGKALHIGDDHPVFHQYLGDWVLCEDVAAGARRIKAAGATYLPILQSEKAKDYAARKQRTPFFNVLGSIRNRIIGAVTRKPVRIDMGSDKYDEWLQDVDGLGTTLDAFIKKVLGHVLITMRAGIFIDRPKEGSFKSRFLFYQARQIRNWGKSFFILEELRHVRPPDNYAYRAEIYRRELTLLDGRPTSRLWRKKQHQGSKLAEGTGHPIASKEEWELVPGEEAILETADNQLPFITIPLEVIPPPFIDLAHMNVSLYNTEADIQHAGHYCGLPTLIATGVAVDSTIYVGAKAAFCTPNKEAKVYYAHIGAGGIQALRAIKEDTKKEIEFLSSDTIENYPARVATAQAERIKLGHQTSLVHFVVDAVEKGILSCLRLKVASDGGDPDKVALEMNRDFILNHMEPQLLNALNDTYDKRFISRTTYLYNLARAEMFPDHHSIEDEAELIDAESGGGAFAEP